MLHHASLFFLIALIAAGFSSFGAPEQWFLSRVALALVALGVVSLGIGLCRKP